MSDISFLQSTDICQHALEALAESKIRRVNLVGRRGPLQVAFTIKELREMTRLSACSTNIHPVHFDSVRDKLQGDHTPPPHTHTLHMSTLFTSTYTHPHTHTPHSSRSPSSKEKIDRTDDKDGRVRESSVSVVIFESL